ncbi:MAG TPA: dTDP-4-dehydrorhamnose 3,5-epimerase [Candidatus Nanoarchaeia archaeon]|nr:dTDP-4-dehydrorhamnose 3,5-epimerase [Candidatus Nanoarchaeia archaeon]
MKVIQTEFAGLLEIIPEVFSDLRGHFFEQYNQEKLTGWGISSIFPLEFQSLSQKGVLRGMHFQKPPHAQGKLVRVVRGAAQDVVIDLRKDSPTFGKWYSTLLSDQNKKMLWIPIGFAHGFLALDDDTIVLYKATDFYYLETESGVIWNDKTLNISWQLENITSKPILSKRDEEHPSFKDAFYF